jgi:hypothetical protein
MMRPSDPSKARTICGNAIAETMVVATTAVASLVINSGIQPPPGRLQQTIGPIDSEILRPD